MKERDMAGKEAQSKSLSPIEKKILHEKYKKLRKKATAQVRQDNITQTGDRIKAVADENEVWQVVKEISKPHTEKELKLIFNAKNWCQHSTQDYSSYSPVSEASRGF